ncbi:GIY-YIG nuclease family protein [Fulvivirga ligni]|uniref:GIY-YIG nuclease family protein n=1 Tax=Fulvivirga ligni TaxID=2904246 RepID=UPI001F41CFF3|nr:GIY-YIG nuclease family protein [Fulvivirga ligni]UII19158.1 GIY-YIG nuclease family protein [Fulvivirga ligni]
MKVKGGYVYIVSNKSRTVLYIGVTSNLASRSWQHKHVEGSQFTKRYKCTDLVYFEFLPDIVSAIAREKQLKKWKRQWKFDLIRTINTDLRDLYNEVGDMK